MNRRMFLKTTLLGAGCALVGSYPVFIERNRVQVNRYRVPVEHLPPAFNGFTIAHLTDVHLGPLVSPAFVSGIVHKTNALGTDMIACTGDYVHARNTAREVNRVWPILSRLSAPSGVFAVLGNHDHWADAERSRYWLKRSGQDIRHRCRPIYRGRDRILVGGAGDYWEDRLGIDDAFSGSDAGECRILLSHNPDAVDTRFRTPLSLVVSGHTHGGQVVIPFWGPPVLPVKNKRYTSGVIAARGSTLFISRGVGWAICPVRFNCSPEIAVLELAAGGPA